LRIPALYRQHEAHLHLRALIVTALRRRGGWDPEIALTGGERLVEARARSRGFILWFDPFAHSPIIGKRAIAEAGVRPWHLSVQGHGVLKSPFADRYLNPRAIEVELRYLAGRIVFDPETIVTATQQMTRVLGENGVVSLTNNAYVGAMVTTPFGGGMVLRLARTPLHLAASRGVALLPVEVIEVEPFRRYRVAIGPDLAQPSPAASPDPIQTIAARYTDYLLPLARAHPAQFNGWGHDALRVVNGSELEKGHVG